MSSGVVSRLPTLLGGVCVEDDRAGCGSRRRIEAARGDLELRLGVDHRMQQLVELPGIDARDSLLAGDEPFVHHLRRRAERSGRRSLAGTGLEKIELALLDRELDVLNIAVVRLEPVERLDQLLERLGHRLAHPVDGLRRTDPGHDVLSLGVQEELAVEPLLAGCGVAREADASPGALATIPEDHLYDVDRGTEVVRDAVRAAVDLCPGRVPRVEHRPIRPSQLLAGVLRKAPARPLLVDRVERVDERAEILRSQIDVLRDPPCGLEIRERLLEAVPVDPVHDLAVHLDQATVGVEGEALVRGRDA